MSKYWQQDVADFHKAFGLTVGDPSNPALSDEALRWRLIMEEAMEFKIAVSELTDNPPDLIEAADAIADIIYVALGAAVTFGLDMGPIWDEVHASNMAKIGGFKDENGKWRKPVGWQPPNIEQCINDQKTTRRLTIDRATTLTREG